MTKAEKARHIIANAGVDCARMRDLHCDTGKENECPGSLVGCVDPEKLLEVAKAYLAEHPESDPTGPRAPVEAKAEWTTERKARYIAENDGKCAPFECIDSDGERCPFFASRCGPADSRRATLAREWLAKNSDVRLPWHKLKMPERFGLSLTPDSYGKPIDVRPLPAAYQPRWIQVRKNPDGTTTFFAPMGTELRSAVDITRETRGKLRAKLLGDE